MKQFGGYWWSVVCRARRDSWAFVFPHSALEIVRSLSIFVVTAILAILFGPAVVSNKLMSADNTQDTIVWVILFGLSGIVLTFVIVFLVHALLIAPYRMWREMKALIPAPPPPSPAPSLTDDAPALPKVPITPYEAGRRLQVIDAGLDLLKEVTPIIETGEILRDAPWFQFRMDPEKKYPAMIRDYQITVHNLAERVDALRNANQEHQDFMGALQQVYYNAAMQKIHDYAEACRVVTDVAGDGSKEALLGLLKPTRDGFRDAVAELTAWRNKARGDLMDMRKQVALV